MDDLAAELHLERLLGRRVRDPSGRVAGRIEEFNVAEVDGEWVVTEFHLGAAAWLERLSVAVRRLPILSALPFRDNPIRIARWNQITFDDPKCPRLLVSRDDLDVATP